MTFKKSHEYYQYKIENIEKAITATIKDLNKASEQRVIDAHSSYLESCRKSLDKTRKEYESWSVKNI